MQSHVSLHLEGTSQEASANVNAPGCESEFNLYLERKRERSGACGQRQKPGPIWSVVGKEHSMAENLPRSDRL
ncbi:MAG TPA: hypothetical protein PKW73_12785, partial [Candidatus Obscuribacter sp.]|nr:hypothetical protein [Candidatus Obscuribacter sp.]